MFIQAEISLYPLGTANLDTAIGSFIDALSRPGVFVAPGNMSTVVEGEMADVFEALQAAMTAASEQDHVVMVLKMSNACPPRPGR